MSKWWIIITFLANILLSIHSGSYVAAEKSPSKCKSGSRCNPSQPPILCGPDEVYNGCANGGCGRWNCSQQGIICIDLIEGACRPGCRCKEGLLRTDDGICVPSDQCPEPTCGTNEVYDICPAPCPPRRCDVDDSLIDCAPPPQPGDPECNPGCRCADGYYRNSDGICVTRDQCDQCGINEEYVECKDSVCRQQSCSELGYPLPCLQALGNTGDSKCNQGPGCVCKQGYVRDGSGVCIPENDCPSCGGDPNAQSGCGVFCKNCDNYNQTAIACPLFCELNGCECKPGYTYDRTIKKCVLPQNCPNTQCPKPNEEYGCDVCGSQSCRFRNFQCLIVVDPATCKRACRCKDGYYRNAIGECVSAEECDQCSGPHEFFSCGPECDNECSTLGVQNRTNCPIINIQCNKKCYCEDGYSRDDNNICVPNDQCPGQCGINEEYVKCKDSVCRQQSCSELGYPLPCLQALGNTGDSKCNQGPGCVCKQGYVRDGSGVCIPENDCPSCGGDPNAQSGCGVFCKNCDNYNQTAIACPLFCELNGCECKPGYTYDRTIKKCVLPQNCPNTQCPKPNEEYGCDVCGSQSCRFRNFQCLIVVDPATCKRACRCKDGYYRNAIGECVSAEECDQCSGPHEFFSCGPECDNECSTLGVQNRTNCPIINIQCNKKCYCEDGYSRDDNNICVPNDQCPGQCGINEEYVKCKDSVCRQQSCSELGYPLPCLQALGNTGDSKCNQGPGCVCKQGYVRDGCGVCIPENDCPSCGGDPNAESGCGVFCETCQNYNQSIACIASCRLNGCQCRKGYIYDTTNEKCVLPQNCPNALCPGRNQEYGCVLCVPQTCPTRRLRCLIRINPATCKRACRCKYGYYKNAIGECISSQECDQCRGPNEFFSCGPECDNECSTLGVQNRTNCPIINIQCNKKCYCKDGYSRNDNNICVPNDQCPVIEQCGINEEYVKCKDSVCRQQSCSELGYPLPCLQALGNTGDSKCNQGPGCVCKQGYVRDDNGVCIPENDCPSCGGDPNAESGCGVFCETCQNYNQSVACILSCQLNGCQCRKGYIYDTTIEKCVLPQNCPNVQCPGPNQEYGCALCVPQTCPTRKLKCLIPINPATCKRTCRCISGYYKNAIGECISSQECDQCSGPNEFFSCGPECDNECSTLGVQNRTNCPIINIQCNKKCYCEDGYSRDNNNICVPNDQCPIIEQCSVNEEYVKCKDSVCRQQSCSELGYPLPCLQALGNTGDNKCNQGPGCVCKLGYVRDDNGVCISEKECPSCRGDPNAESGCGVFCETCQNYNQTVACPLLCIFNGCQCRKGYIYDTTIQKCVLPQNCNIQCETNEIFVDCPAAQCRPTKCSEVGFPIACPRYSKCPSKPGCVCDYGYVKDDNDICIPIAQCPSCGGDSNAVSGCGTNCNKKCSKESNACPDICAINGCDCKPGFLFDENLKRCVQPEQCSVQCKKNEEYVDCPESQCRPTNCSEVGFPKVCRQYYTCPSKPGCVCAYGYVRGNFGNCIPIKQCPSCGGDDNAISGCGTYCNNRCSGKPVPCPKICKVNSCDCKPGFLFDETCNKCVLPDECPDNTNDNTDDNNKDDDNNDDNNNNDNNNDDNSNGGDGTNNNNAPDKLLEGNRVFTGNFLYNIVKSNPGKSVNASPFSLLFLLAQLLLYATGEAKSQLSATVNLNSSQQIQATIPPLLTSFTTEKNITFTLVENVYNSEDYPLSDNFKKDTKEIFLAEAQNLNFRNSAESAKIINDWVASKTNDLITNLVPKEALNANTRLVLVNAIYFKGNWQKSFKKENTKTKDFYVSESNTVSVQMMNMVATIRYGTWSNAQVVELPYQNTNFTFLVILPPKTQDGMNNLLEEQRNASAIGTALQQLRPTKVDLSIPKFRIDTTIDLINLLKKPNINITEIFNPNNSGLEGILKTPEKLYVTDAIQKAVTIVNEEGVEAAAGNAVIVVMAAAAPLL